MTADRWDSLPADWSVTMHPTTATHYIPLDRMLRADVVWRNLTRPQQELLLSCAADAPIRARADVTGRVIRRGLINPDLTVTDAGREIVEWRTT